MGQCRLQLKHCRTAQQPSFKNKVEVNPTSSSRISVRISALSNFGAAEFTAPWEKIERLVDKRDENPPGAAAAEQLSRIAVKLP